MVACGLIKLFCFTLIAIGASIILTRVIKQKSFIVLRNQSILILLYSFTVLMDGLYLTGISDKYFDYYEGNESWFKRLFGLTI